MAKLRAEITPYSSVTGQGVSMVDTETGAHVFRLLVVGVTADDYKGACIAVAGEVAKRLDGMESCL